MSKYPYLELLCRNASARRLWLAQLTSQLGEGISLIALLQLANQFTGDAELVGGVFILQVVPAVVLGPVAGVAADRFDRRRLMVTTDLLRVVIVCGLIIAAHEHNTWLLFVLAGLQSCGAAFFEPARQALIPVLTRGDELRALNALTGATWMGTSAIGGMLGAGLIHTFGYESAFAIDALTFIISAWLLAGLRVPRRGEKKPRVARGQKTAARLTDYLKQRRAVIAILLVKAGQALTGGGFWLVVVVMGQRLFVVGKDGVLSVGTLNMAVGFGAVAGCFLGGAVRGPARRVVRFIAGFFFLRAALVLALALAPNLAVAAITAAAASAAGAVLTVTSTNLLHTLAPNQLHGRLFGVDLTLMTAAFIVSVELSGWAMGELRIPPSETAMGLALAGLVVATLWLPVLGRRRWGQQHPSGQA